MASVCDRGYCSCVQVRSSHWRHRFADMWVSVGLLHQIHMMAGNLNSGQQETINQTWLKGLKEQFANK